MAEQLMFAGSGGSGRCVRCNRVLSNPVSMRRGAGPTCAAKMEAALVAAEKLEEEESDDVEPTESGATRGGGAQAVLGVPA